MAKYERILLSIKGKYSLEKIKRLLLDNNIEYGSIENVRVIFSKEHQIITSIIIFDNDHKPIYQIIDTKASSLMETFEKYKKRVCCPLSKIDSYNLIPSDIANMKF